MSDAITGMGITYEIGATAGLSPTTYTEIMEVYDVVPPNQQTDEIEVTHYKSVGGYREFIAGLKDGGEVTISLNWIPGSTTDVLLRGLHASGELRLHRITFANDSTISYPGWIKGLERSSPYDDRQSMNVTVRVAGNSTYEDATP